MEKSIETIWKEGFLKSDKLVAPKLNDLYNQKSIHLIDRFKRRIKINLNALIVGALLSLVVFTLIGIPMMGVGYFLTIGGIVVVNKKLFSRLVKIDKGENSYTYISAFDDFLKHAVSVNRKLSMLYYPLLFLSMIFGLWQAGINAREIIGGDWIDEMILNYPNTDVVLSIKMVTISVVITITVLFTYFGGRIYDWDKNLSYGSLFGKLAEIVSDMEELRS